MKQKYRIEKTDNGYVIFNNKTWYAEVAYDDDFPNKIGELINADINAFMDENDACAIELTITINERKPIL